MLFSNWLFKFYPLVHQFNEYFALFTFLLSLFFAKYNLITGSFFRSGTVWQCPLTQSRTDCTQIRGIVPGSSVPPRADEIRNDQWLGVAVSSQGPGMFELLGRTWQI